MPTLEQLIGAPLPIERGMVGGELGQEMPLEGLKLAPKVAAAIAMKILEFVLPALDLDSKERKSIIKAIEQLDSIAADVSIEDIKAVANLIQKVANLPAATGVGGPGAMPGMMAGMMPGMMPGGAPGGIPGGAVGPMPEVGTPSPMGLEEILTTEGR